MELASRLHKQVNVVVHGRTVRFPLQYGEVFNALLHLIRNAIDHGIEPAHERQGKSLIGTLTIQAEEKSHEIIISISDDGGGIDLKRVRDIAVAKGLTTEENWKLLTPEEQIQFVTISGLSTRKEVTHISGRGIGLDVVASSLKRFGGNLFFQQVRLGNNHPYPPASPRLEFDDVSCLSNWVYSLVRRNPRAKLSQYLINARQSTVG